jgi:NAD(P)-dependent dehydrogenase (short-subunit alcohol dehydrogenase family)
MALRGLADKVVVGDLAADPAQRTADRIVAAGGTAIAVVFDLAEPDSVAHLIDTAATTYGGVDSLFTVGADMAALRGDSDVVDIDLDLWDRVMTVNLRGYAAAMQHAIPQLLYRGGGAIVNMSSAAAFQGEPTRPAYATAKAGIGALTRHVASRWGKVGIRGTRVGDIDDIASLVAFLLSDEGAWINGQIINIDGGTVLR